MPLLIVFAAGAALTGIVTCLGALAGTALVVGLIAGFALRPLVIGVIGSW